MQNHVEERTDMTGTFPGRIVLVEGDQVDVDLQMGAGRIRLATPFAEIGSWEIDSVEITPQTDGSFELAVDEDVVTFFPSDPSAFAAVIDGATSEPFTFPGQPVSGSPETTSEPDPPVELEPTDGPVIQGSGSIDDLSAALEALRSESDDEFHDAPVDTQSDGAPDTPTHALSEEPTDEPSDELPDESAPRPGFPSSRGRLSAAMASVRGRKGSEDADEDTKEDADDDETASRRVSSGFAIPGDPGYVDPLAAPPAAIENDEDLDDGDTIADEIVESSSALRLTTTTRRSLPFRKVGIGVAIVALIGAIAFATPTVIDILSPDADTAATVAPDTTVPETSTTAAPTTTTLASTTTVPAPVVSDAFDVSSQRFVEDWNAVADDVNPALRFRTLLPSGDFEAGFTQYIAMLGTIGPDGTLDRFTIEVDPAGPSESDQLGIQVLGVAIAVVDPSLEPAQRAELLGVLGLDVRNPELGGLDGRVTRNGVTYELRYDEESVRLLLSVQPAG